jgi:hypothetical protein
MVPGRFAGTNWAMLDWFLQLRRANVVRSNGECDAEALCLGVVLIALGIALL